MRTTLLSLVLFSVAIWCRAHTYPSWAADVSDHYVLYINTTEGRHGVFRHIQATYDSAVSVLTPGSLLAFLHPQDVQTLVVSGRALHGESLRDHHKVHVDTTGSMQTKYTTQSMDWTVLSVSVAHKLDAHSVANAWASEKKLAKAKSIQRVGKQKIQVKVRAYHALEVMQILVAQPEVRWVEEAPVFQTLNEIATWTLQSSIEHTTPVWDHNLTGIGQLVHVGDEGLDHDSCFFRDPDEAVSLWPEINPMHRKVISIVPSEKPDGTLEHGGSYSGHGTHVAGSLLGKPQDTSHAKWGGMAHDAKLIFSDLSWTGDLTLTIPSNLLDYFAPGYEAGAKVSSSSWGSNTSPRAYSPTDQETDEFAYEHDDLLVVFAAGNQGAVGVLSPAASKNVLTVGATWNSKREQERENVASFSAIGPTFDGRIKPEVLGPGRNVMSAFSDGNLNTNQCMTNVKSGTSMSAPLVAGAAVLARQYFVDGWYPTGRREDKNGFSPSSSLLRAFIVHGTRPVHGQGPAPSDTIPNGKQGWGALHLDDVVLFAENGKDYPHKDLKVYDRASVGHHQEWHQCFTAADHGQLKLTMAWLDPPVAALGSTHSLVNNLDLVLVGTKRDTTLMWKANGKPHFDEGNNVEHIAVDSHEGEGVTQWKVSVYGTSIHVGAGAEGSQDFAVVISGHHIDEVQCAPSKMDCSGHGVAGSDGVCQCNDGWHHVDCSVCDGDKKCHGHGTCSPLGECTCEGHWNSDCSSCTRGWYGPLCNQDCKCGSHGSCDKEKGLCVCTDSDTDGHWGGEKCDRCAMDWRGPKCDIPSHWCRTRKGPMSFKDMNGIIQINGNSAYDASMRCEWRIETPHPSWRINLIFDNFDIEQNYDWLTVYDGAKVNVSHRIIRATGSRNPNPLVATSGSMLVRFESDISSQRSGFVARWEINKACSSFICSGHGVCNSSSDCVCAGNSKDGFWDGLFCDTCFRGWGGPICATQGSTEGPTNLPCKTDIQCNNHGACDNGVCKCYKGWDGRYCDTGCPVHALYLGCAGHGTCRSSEECECNPGYFGKYCQLRANAIVPIPFAATSSLGGKGRWAGAAGDAGIAWSIFKYDPLNTNNGTQGDVSFIMTFTFQASITLILWDDVEGIGLFERAIGTTRWGGPYKKLPFTTEWEGKPESNAYESICMNVVNPEGPIYLGFMAGIHRLIGVEVVEKGIDCTESPNACLGKKDDARYGTHTFKFSRCKLKPDMNFLRLYFGTKSSWKSYFHEWYYTITFFGIFLVTIAVAFCCTVCIRVCRKRRGFVYTMGMHPGAGDSGGSQDTTQDTEDIFDDDDWNDVEADFAAQPLHPRTQPLHENSNGNGNGNGSSRVQQLPSNKPNAEASESLFDIGL